MDREVQQVHMDHLAGALEGQLLVQEAAHLYPILGQVVHGVQVGALTPDLSIIQHIPHQLYHRLSLGAQVTLTVGTKLELIHLFLLLKILILDILQDTQAIPIRILFMVVESFLQQDYPKTTMNCANQEVVCITVDFLEELDMEQD